jgi:hypothetical protein
MRISRNLVLLGMAAVALWGCGSRESTNSASPTAATGTAKKPSPAQTTMRTMVRAFAANKNVTVPVQVRFQLQQRPAVGQPVDVNLVILPSSTVDRISGEVQADDGLEVVDGAQIPAADRPAEGVPIAHSIKVVPKRDGIFTFSAVLNVDSGGQTATQTFSMPIIAGSGVPGLAEGSNPPAHPAAAATVGSATPAH